MKTPDHISKKRQRLSQELEVWLVKERSAYTRETILFCRQEATKCRQALESLATRTRWQRKNGWQ